MTSFREIVDARTPCAVGAITDRNALSQRFTSNDCDLIELRLDALGHDSEVFTFAKLHTATHPILLTARGPEEGGLQDLSIQDRRIALTALLPHAAAIDIELRAIPELEDVWNEAGEKGLVRIASSHNFNELPPTEEIIETLDAMNRAGAEVAKVAYLLADEEDLGRLAGAARKWGHLPLSFMGMGPLGPASRTLAVLNGSVLNYGYLGEQATAPGQWPAHLLKQVIACSPKVAKDPPTADQ